MILENLTIGELTEAIQLQIQHQIDRYRYHGVSYTTVEDYSYTLGEDTYDVQMYGPYGSQALFDKIATEYLKTTLRATKNSKDGVKLIPNKNGNKTIFIIL